MVIMTEKCTFALILCTNQVRHIKTINRFIGKSMRDKTDLLLTTSWHLLLSLSSFPITGLIVIYYFNYYYLNRIVPLYKSKLRHTNDG